MKKRITTLMVIGLGLLPCMSTGEIHAEISPKMKIFNECVVLTMEGIHNRDKEAISNASEGFASLESDIFLEGEDYTVDGAKNLVEPEVRFDSDFCNIMKLNNFEFVKMDNLNNERHIIPTFCYLPTAIKGGKEATFHFMSINETNIGVGCAEKDALTFTLHTPQGDIPMNRDETGYVYYADWFNGDSTQPFSLTVKNNTKKPISFTIAVE